MKTPIRNYRLALVGLGTAGLAAARAVLRRPSGLLPIEVLLVDCGAIEDHNIITCPEYAAYDGSRKVSAAADLLGLWTGGHIRTLMFDGQVEKVDWHHWALSGKPGELLVVLAGLDDFQSRVCLLQDLRESALKARAELINVQVGLAGGMGVVSTFSRRWEDACPACFLPQLPVPEPCVVFGGDGHLLRGDLQREARVCAIRAVRIVRGCLESEIDYWTNKKTVLRASGTRFQSRTRRRRRMPGCFGAHHSSTPIRWDRVDLPTFEEM